jgi:hypothetical protein
LLQPSQQQHHGGDMNVVDTGHALDQVSHVYVVSIELPTTMRTVLYYFVPYRTVLYCTVYWDQLCCHKGTAARV